MIDITVVIATRNRFDHLRQTVQSIEAQTFLPKEIIIVDASDNHESVKKVVSNKISIRLLFSKPSVCAQRNIGINEATSDWILLCDDDIEFEQDYLKKLVDYVTKEKEVGAVAGLLMQKENNEWVKNYPINNFKALLWKFIFQHSIWGTIDFVKSPPFLKPLHQFLVSFYKQKDNTQTLAGWPLITNWSGDVVHTKFFSIGANLVKKDWLLKSPYEEKLDAHGIGDNYGVALGFVGDKPIEVLTNAFAYHHRAMENREGKSKVKYLRILALDYFLKKQRSNFKTRAFFIWSLIGHCLYSLLRERKYFATYAKVFFKVVLNKNPLQP